MFKNFGEPYILMNRKAVETFLAFSTVALALLYVSYIYSEFFASESEKYCKDVSDCSCGVNIYTGDCFFGNKNFVDTTKQCPDFCNGIAANLILRCVNNTCVHTACMCPEGYMQIGNACAPSCYFSTPPCLAPTIPCTGAK
jgi:hypothetical protein